MFTNKKLDNEWDTVKPFHCQECNKDVDEGWSFKGRQPVCGDCGGYLRPSRWLTRFYTRTRWERSH